MEPIQPAPTATASSSVVSPSETVVSANTSLQPQVSAPSPPLAGLQTVVYAGFRRRLVAVLIDVIILSLVNFLISLSFGIALGVWSAVGRNSSSGFGSGALLIQLVIGLLQLAIGIAYPIYFIGSRGQTLGKKAMGIKVVKIDTGEHPDYVGAFLRESVGKLLSSFVLALGFLWMIWDEKKQTWHDKIAGTVVVRV